MKLTNKLAVSSAVFALLAAAPSAVMAQETTSQLRGTVQTSDGQAVADAQITLIHIPTGSARTVTTSDNGSFSAANLRVGGPYSITIVAEGYEAAVLEGVRLNPGSNDPLRVAIDRQVEDQIVIRGERSALSIGSGVGSAFDATDLASQPSAGRDFTDILARDPLVSSSGNGQLNIAGINSAYNGLTVNGVPFQEEFGINSSGVFATQRPTIDLNAVEAVSVQVADYSVINNGFQGGLVNLVTKSGTNEFDGVIGYYYTDDSLGGDKVGSFDVDRGDFEEKELSINVGGPIIKDKLFFFVSYSDFENTQPAFFDFGDTDPQIFDLIRQATIDTYSYDPGAKSGANNDSTTERFLVKLDWNITDAHRAAFTYTKVEEFEIGSFGTFDFPTASREEPLENQFYTFELLSDWTANFSTQLRVAFKEADFSRTPIGQAGGAAGSNFSSIRINDITGSEQFFVDEGVNGAAIVGANPISLVLGPDRFDQANSIVDERTTIFFRGDYVMGDHTITGGFNFEEYSVDNTFVPGSSGVAEFDNLDNFLNQTVDDFFVDLPATGTIGDAITRLSYETLALFIQDTWQVNDKLEVNFGLRYETIIQDDSPSERLDVELLDGSVVSFQEAYGISGTDGLDGVDIILPRVGFNYSATDRLTIRGGVGKFSGGNPAVLLANQFVPLTFRGSADGFAGFTGAIPQVALDEITAASAAALGNTVPAFGVFGSDFEWPSQLRYSLAADYSLNLESLGLGDDYRVGVQFVRSQASNGVYFKNLGWERSDLAALTGVAPDGRPIYPNMNELNESAPILIDNADEGFSNNIVFSLAKQYDNGFSFDFSYTWQEVEELNPLTSSRAISQFRGQYGPDRNAAVSVPGVNQNEHSFRFFFGYEKDLYKDLKTSIGLFGTLRSGEPYSLGFRSFNHLFGVASDGEFPYGNNDPLYVPELNSAGTGFNDPIVNFASQATADALFEFSQAAGILGFSGGLVPVGYEDGPWRQRWDLSIEQELPGIPGVQKYIGENNLALTIDIQNVANLINSDWGQQDFGPRFNALTVVRADLIEVDGAGTPIDTDPLTPDTQFSIIDGSESGPVCGVTTQCEYLYQFLENDASDLRTTNFGSSVWFARIGIEYRF